MDVRRGRRCREARVGESERDRLRGVIDLEVELTLSGRRVGWDFAVRTERRIEMCLVATFRRETGEQTRERQDENTRDEDLRSHEFLPAVWLSWPSEGTRDEASLDQADT